VLDRELTAPAFKSLRWVNIDSVAARGREMCCEQPLTLAELGENLALEFPGQPARTGHRGPQSCCAGAGSAAWPMAQPGPDRACAGGCLARQPVAGDRAPTRLIMRYLAAFGPATAIDIATWSGLRGIKAALEGMRDELVWLTDDRGRTLVDVPDGILPDPDTPAPVRLLPEYDNTLLSHADRTRIIEDGDRPFVLTRAARSAAPCC